jgi:uncharacterized membrane protein
MIVENPACFMRNKFYNKKMKKAVFSVSFFLAMFAANLALAQGVNIDNPLRYNSVEEIINAIINWFFYIAIVLVPLIIVIGAFIILTSAGDSGKVKKGKSLIVWSLIGFAIILFSKGIISLIKSIIGVS